MDTPLPIFGPEFKVSVLIGAGLTLAVVVISLVEMKPTTKRLWSGICGATATACFGGALYYAPLDWEWPLIFRSPVSAANVASTELSIPQILMGLVVGLLFLGVAAALIYSIFSFLRWIRRPAVVIAESPSSDRNLELLESQLALKDATIEAKTATIETLNSRLQTSNAHVQESISKFEQHSPPSEELASEIRQLIDFVRANEAPLLELQPQIMGINPIGPAQSRIFCIFKVRNLGGPTSLYDWQSQVELPTRSIHLVQGVFNQGEIAESSQGLGGKNFVGDDRALQKGEARTGWVEFVVVGDPQTDGPLLQVRRVLITVADYTNKRYSFEVPPSGVELPTPLPPAPEGKPPTMEITPIVIPKKRRR